MAVWIGLGVFVAIIGFFVWRDGPPTVNDVEGVVYTLIIAAFIALGIAGLFIGSAQVG